MKIIKEIFHPFVLFIIVVFICMVVSVGPPMWLSYFHECPTCPTPTITYMQERMITEGYDLGPTGADGVIGGYFIQAYTLWSTVNDPDMVGYMQEFMEQKP